jgi:hypothetical protein
VQSLSRNCIAIELLGNFSISVSLGALLENNLFLYHFSLDANLDLSFCRLN